MTYEQHVDITGAKEILQALKRKVGPMAMKTVEDEFAKKAGKAGQTIVKRAESSYKRTGATIAETRFRLQRNFLGHPTAVIGWSGPKERQKLVHLNELGYEIKDKNGGPVRRIRPRGFGKIEAAKKEIGVKSLEIARKVVEERLKK